MGLTPTTLEGSLMEEITEIAQTYCHRVEMDKISCVSYWNQNRAKEAGA